MATVKIEWLSDSNQCEQCGGGGAMGARVFIDGAVAIELIPKAHCFDSPFNWPEHEVWRQVFDKLGHTLEEPEYD